MRAYKTWLGVATMVASASLVDVVLVGTGFAAAGGSVLFAGEMLMRGDRAPGVNGLQYLAIFGRPRGGAKAPKPPVLETSGDTIDTTPVGSIARAEDKGYAIVSAQRDFAWVRDGGRIFAVRPGDALPRLGRVSAIAPRDGRWTIVGDSGATLLSQVAPSARLGEDIPFGRRFIFESGK